MIRRLLALLGVTDHPDTDIAREAARDAVRTFLPAERLTREADSVVWRYVGLALDVFEDSLFPERPGDDDQWARWRDQLGHDIKDGA